MKISAEGKEIIYGTIFFIIIAVGTVSYMVWHAKQVDKATEASLSLTEDGI